MALGSCCLAALSDVFQEHLLHHLPVTSLARLRAASKEFRALVDTGTGAAWQRAAGRVLAPKTVPQAADGQAVQARLRSQAHALKNLKSGNVARPQLQHCEDNGHWFGFLDWSPCDPRDGLCHYVLAHTTLIPCALGCPGSSIWQHSLELPTAPNSALASEISWHYWCWDHAQDLYLIYHSASQDKSLQLLYALNTQAGRVVAARVLHLDLKDNGLFQALKPSPNGRQLILVQSSSDILVLNLPSLAVALKIWFGTAPELGPRWTDWVGWTSSSQLILVIRTADALYVRVYSACDGALLASRKIGNGCFERLGYNNVAASPHHPYLAITFRKDPDKALSRLTPRQLEAFLRNGPLQSAEEAQAKREAILQADIRYWTLVLDLGNCRWSVYPVAHGRCFYPAKRWLCFSWAPDGLTVACEKGTQCGTDLLIWHGPSASVIGLYQGRGIHDVVWSPNGKFCALTPGCSIKAMLHLESANDLAAVGEMRVEPYQLSRPSLCYSERRQCFTFSPCSRRLLYWGKLSGVPAASVRMLQWSIDPVQGIGPPEDVMDRFPPQELEPTGCTWLASPPAACLYVVTLSSGLVHFMSGLERPQASPFATLNVKEVWTDSHEDSLYFNYTVSHDGLTLFCQNVRDQSFAFFRFDVG